MSAVLYFAPCSSRLTRERRRRLPIHKQWADRVGWGVLGARNLTSVPYCRRAELLLVRYSLTAAGVRNPITDGQTVRCMLPDTETKAQRSGGDLGAVGSNGFVDAEEIAKREVFAVGYVGTMRWQLGAAVVVVQRLLVPRRHGAVDGQGLAGITAAAFFTIALMMPLTIQRNFGRGHC